MVISVRTPSTGYALGGSTGMILATGDTAAGRVSLLLLGVTKPPAGGAKVKADRGQWPDDDCGREKGLPSGTRMARWLLMRDC